jgi:hypothetical protein
MRIYQSYQQNFLPMHNHIPAKSSMKQIVVLLLLSCSCGVIFSSCAIPLSTALTMKEYGVSRVYPLSFEQTYTTARTALRWAAERTALLRRADVYTIEDYQEQGYLLKITSDVNSFRSINRNTTSFDYTIIWCDQISPNETKVTIMTCEMASVIQRSPRFPFKPMDYVEDLQYLLDYGMKLTKDGKPLPILP